MSARRVAIVAAAYTPKPGSSRVRQTFKEMIVESSYQALANAGMDAREIQGVAYGYHGEGISEYGGLGPTISDTLGVSPAPTFITSSNCTSSSVSFQMGHQMVASGEYDIVLCGGFEKMTDHFNYAEYIGSSTECEYDYFLGISHTDAFALATSEYFHRYGYAGREADVLAAFGRQMRVYAHNTPNATRFGQPIPSLDELKKSEAHGSMLAWGEASGCAILVAEHLAHKYTDKPVFIKGCAYTGVSHYFGTRYHNPTLRHPGLATDTGMALSANSVACAEIAYKKAGISAKDIDVAQVYDLLGAGLIQMESMGICKPGQAGHFVLEGGIAIDGEVPLNTDGGNIGRGHASGCDGILHITELFRQLRGESDNQVKNARIAVSQNLGGYAAHNSVIVLGNE
ncbi:2,4-diacetylphloroglucinol biosynthesis protein [Chromobacterium vaccinii]|uniref:thiolase family protein n=1 Tax=Chromobacterium vaccinii TaxID=1108595 RepID=UPI000CE952D1|nr:thiolase family protein [Chromobacterium vaccinii]AVG16580.1 2,4-diacetylphloroglucinol biosynthesis protein [Chromobacterium vaccinii]